MSYVKAVANSPTARKSRPNNRLISIAVLAATCLMSSNAAALGLIVEQVKISGLLLNTNANSSQTSTYGTGQSTIFGYADSVITTNTNALATNIGSNVPTAIVNNTIVDGINTIAVKADAPLAAASASIQGLYRVTFTLTGSGNPVFANQLDANRIKLISAAATNCAITTQPFIIDGGNAGQYYVTYQFSLSTACSEIGRAHV